MKAVKGQAFADFLADHAMNQWSSMKKSSPLQRWTLYFDGSSTLGAGVVLAPQAAKRLKFQTWRYHRLGKTAFVRMKVSGKVWFN